MYTHHIHKPFDTFVKVLIPNQEKCSEQQQKPDDHSARDEHSQNKRIAAARGFIAVQGHLRKRKEREANYEHVSPPI
jgi:hypothetical protein